MTTPYIPPGASSLEYFGLLVAEDREFNLMEAAVSVAQIDTPEVDPTEVLARIDRMANDLRRRLPADAGATQRLRVLCHYFFRELGFAGNVNDYHAIDNSYLHRVLETRRGIPITLALLLMELGGQCGLRMSGISFPGHFLVKCSLSQGEVVLDPFDGRSLAREALDERLMPYRQEHGLVGDFEVPLGLFLQPASPRAILARLLRNLKQIHWAQEDWLRLAAVQDRLVLLLPEEGAERRDRGLVRAELEQWADAAADLDAYLLLEPGAQDAEALTERLEELRRLARMH